MKKTVGANRQVFVYAPGGQLINEMTTTGKWVADYVYLNGRPLARIAPAPKVKPSPPSLTDMPTDAGTPPDKETFYYYHLDHLGTPIAMTDESKTIVWSTDYYPFGTTLDETVVQSNEFRFPGQYHDRETDLYYNWHRYYDSKTGRYTTRDPLGLAGGDVNLYRYVLDNPLRFLDFDGRQPPSGWNNPLEPWERMWWDIVPWGPSPGSDASTYERLQASATVITIAGGILIFIPGGQPVGAALLITATGITALEGTMHLSDYIRGGDIEDLKEAGLCGVSVVTKSALVKQLRRVPALKHLNEDEINAIVDLVWESRELLGHVTRSDQPTPTIDDYRHYAE